MGAFEDAVKKKEDEAAAKKADAAARFNASVRDLAGSARIAAMKEEERGKAMKKYASMKEK